MIPNPIRRVLSSIARTASAPCSWADRRACCTAQPSLVATPTSRSSLASPTSRGCARAGRSPARVDRRPAVRAEVSPPRARRPLSRSDPSAPGMRVDVMTRCAASTRSRHSGAAADDRAAGRHALRGHGAARSGAGEEDTARQRLADDAPGRGGALLRTSTPRDAGAGELLARASCERRNYPSTRRHRE